MESPQATLMIRTVSRFSTGSGTFSSPDLPRARLSLQPHDHSCFERKKGLLIMQHIGVAVSYHPLLVPSASIPV